MPSNPIVLELSLAKSKATVTRYNRGKIKNYKRKKILKNQSALKQQMSNFEVSESIESANTELIN